MALAHYGRDVSQVACNRAFTSLSWALAQPMRSLDNLLNDRQRFSACVRKVMELDMLRPQITDSAKEVDHNHMNGKAEFKRVFFRYDQQQVLEDISFTVDPGCTLAIMEPTGSDKTTQVHLLAHFHAPTSPALRHPKPRPHPLYRQP